MNTVSSLILLAVGLPVAYLYLFALAAVRTRATQPSQQPRHRFGIAIPAHNEEAVIGRTVATLRQLDYPRRLFDIHIVADHCTDRTAQVARAAGAIVHERHEGSRGSKGAALRWLFARILDETIRNPQPVLGHAEGSATRNLACHSAYDAAVIFDADTQAHPAFLRVMDARLAQGDQVIQGQHRVSNPDDGWFPALTWAMFMVDNRFQNLGRANLGWSAKNMGDSICFQASVLRRLGWGEGLTEDYAFRQRLLLDGIKIRYELAAIGYGEAPATWRVARTQRARWLRGTHDASRRYARQLLREGLRRHDMALLDGALQAYLPSYSSLTLIALAAWLVHVALALFRYSPFAVHWSCLLVLLALYPLLGLALEHAPLRAYLIILSGPLFILWRTWLALVSRFGRRSIEWMRTPRKVQ